MTFRNLSEANQALHLADLEYANAARCHEVYHPIKDWSVTDWACAAAGEMGEACNLIKKMRRNMINVEGYPIHLKEAIGEELADTVIYIDLLCQRLGIRLEDMIRQKFNATSEKIGSEIKL